MDCYLLKYARKTVFLNIGYGFSDMLNYNKELLNSIETYILKTVEEEKNPFYSYYPIKDYAVFTYSTSVQADRVDSDVKIGLINLEKISDKFEFAYNFLKIKTLVFNNLLFSFQENKRLKLEYTLSSYKQNIDKSIYENSFILKFAKAVFISAINPQTRLMFNYDENSSPDFNSKIIENMVYGFVPFPSVVKCGYIGRTKKPIELSFIKFYFHQESSFQIKELDMKKFEENSINIVDFVRKTVSMPKTEMGYIERILAGLSIEEIENLIKYINEDIKDNKLYDYYEDKKCKFYEAVIMFISIDKKLTKLYPTETERNKVLEYLRNKRL
jgi:hypothetical protein